MKLTNYVAILGFAGQIDQRRKFLAKETAEKLVALGFGISVGNLSGTFKYALKSAKECGGTTLGIVERDLCLLEHQDCDVLHVVSAQEMKHEAISDQSMGGIVIGGGDGTLKLIQHFLDRNKTIVAIDGSGGIVPSELDSDVILSHSVDHALNILVRQSR